MVRATSRVASLATAWPSWLERPCLASSVTRESLATYRDGMAGKRHHGWRFSTVNYTKNDTDMSSEIVKIHNVMQDKDL